MTDRRTLAAIASIGLLNLFAIGAPSLLQSYDAQTHLFFADHYRQAWFDLWEQKWFDGMWVISYPPLVHQLIALVGMVADLDLGYRLVQLCALLAFPLSIRQLAIETVGPRYASWAALLAIGVPGVYVELYTWGQLPSFVGMVLGLYAAALFGRFLRTGRALPLAAGVAMTGAATAAHHHTVIFILPLLMAAMVVRWWLLRRPVLRRALLRPFGAGLALGVVAAAALLPFWWWLATHYLPQAELPHPTRDGIFRTQADGELFFWGLYGAFLVLAPAGLAILVSRRRSWLPLGLLIALLGVLGLGTLTPLPSVVFAYGDMWRWLVYERFAVWAAVLCALPAGVFVERIARSRVRWPACALIAGVLLFGVVRESTFGVFHPLIPRPLQAWEEIEILKFLGDGNHATWNYVTFGLGEAEMARISRLSGARTLDGLYYTARERPELRASGVGAVDTAYWWRTGHEILPQVIEEPDRWNLKWAVLALPRLEEELRTAGWRKLYTLGSPPLLATTPSLYFQQSTETQEAFAAVYGDRAVLAWEAEHGVPAPTSLVSIWEAPPGLQIPPLEPPTNPDYPALLALWWGTVPLLLLVLSLILVILPASKVSWWRPGLSTPARSRKHGLALPSFPNAVLPWHRS